MLSNESQSQGDTQPISQWVYDEFTNRNKAARYPSEARWNGHLTNNATPSTYAQGQIGHVDIVGLFEQPAIVAHEDDLDDRNGDDLGGISQVDVRAELYPESKRFQQPITPATTGKKRNHKGEVVDPCATTPRLPINPFANQQVENGGIMDLSQVFRATQAPSSPLTNKLPSEDLQERPSPDMYNLQRPSTSDTQSSPAKFPRLALQPAMTEPQTNYISMKESQAERDRRLRLQEVFDADMRTHPEELSEDDFGVDASQLRRRENQKRIDAAAKDLFVGITAPPRPSSSGRGRADLQVVKPRRTDNHDPVLISDDTPPDAIHGNATEDETEHEEDVGMPEAELPDELAEDNKENMGVGAVQVPMTNSRLARRNFSVAASQRSPSSRQRRLVLSPVRDELDELADDPVDHHNTSSAEVIGTTVDGAQEVAVADSQPCPSNGRQEQTQISCAPQTPALVSSLDSRMLIPQSQSGSPHAAKIDSSMVRRLNDLGDSSPTRGPPAMYSQHHCSPILPNCSSQSVHISPEHRSCSPMPQRKGKQPPRLFDSSPPLLRSKIPVATTRKDVSSTAMGEFNSSVGNGGMLPHKREVPQEVSHLLRSGRVNEPQSNAGLEEGVQSPHHEHSGTATLKSTIPETISIVRHREGFGSVDELRDTSKPNIASAQDESKSSSDAPQPHLQSNMSSLFDTAHTHLTISPSKTYFERLRQQPELNRSSSSPKGRRARTLTDIAADPSPQDNIGEVDIDVGLITTEDVHFQSIIEGSSPIGPARKRRRGQGGRVLRAAAPTPNSSSFAPRSSAGGQPEGNVERLAASSSIIEDQASPQMKPRPEEPTPKSKHNIEGNDMLEIAKPKRIPTARYLDTAVGRTHVNVPTIIEPVNRPPSDDLQIDAQEASTGTTRGAQNVNRHGTSEAYGNAVSVEDSIFAPNRVFAYFTGNCTAYYPATCLGVTGSEEIRYKVRFDDGTVDVVGGNSVRRLLLRVGDNIKLDHQGARSQAYVVRGFGDRQHPVPGHYSQTSCAKQRGGARDVSQFPCTDIYGYSTILVSPKQRKSLSENRLQGEDYIPLQDVYLTQRMWKNFNDRFYSYHSSLPVPASGLQTPSERPSTPSTPSSRNRRVKASGQVHSLLSKPSSLSRNGTGIFENMVFTITNVEDPQIREQSVQHIMSNGGRLLEPGYDELFQLPELEPASPSKRSPYTTRESFRLTPEAACLGFTCLIADKHCRTAKFIQALALGIPCLATRWVHDCVSMQRLMSWEPYLLPSGESSFLGGAVRSRLLPFGPTDSALLPRIIDGRPKFLAGCSILLIMGKGKETEMMKAYPLIAHALGARKVSQAVSLEAARKAILEAEAVGDEWDWVYYYEGEKQSEKISEQQAEKILFGTAASAAVAGAGAGRKRKSGASEAAVRRGKARVVGKEFVIQSLISGQLVDG
ncbi:hypothetical protein MMC24_006429 [Lignoscripta atroalba]|nr:hypothetical protein [Lignoscripta atroalba]